MELDRHALGIATLVVGALGACSGSTAGRASGDDRAAPPPHLSNTSESTTASAPVSSARAPEGPPIAEFAADLDGDGRDEEIVVHRNLVRIGDRTRNFDRYTDGLDVAVIDIDATDGRRELAVIDHGIEDDGSYFIFPYLDGRITGPTRQLFLRDGIPGDGTLTERFGNCGEETKVVWHLVNGTLDKVGRWTTGHYDDAKCAACPFVDVRTVSGTSRVGEILRNLNHAGLEALQSLELPAAAIVDGRIHVVLAERKPEVTHLDELYLTVDGIHFLPTACAISTSNTAAWCVADQQRATIDWGDTLHVEFVVGDVSDPAEVLLWGRGYYEPIHP